MEPINAVWKYIVLNGTVIQLIALDRRWFVKKYKICTGINKGKIVKDKLVIFRDWQKYLCDDLTLAVLDIGKYELNFYSDVGIGSKTRVIREYSI